MRRPTPDLIALILTMVVAVVVIATTFAVLYIKVTHPDQPIFEAVDAISRIIAVLVAVLAGFLAGRKINGHGS